MYVSIRNLVAMLVLGLAAVAPQAHAAPSASKPSKAKQGTFADIGLPRYEAPAAYHEDLVMHSKDGDFTLKRSVDHGRIRTDMESQGQKFSMIEVGDERGTMITLMPDEKRAMKQSRAGAEESM